MQFLKEFFRTPNPACFFTASSLEINLVLHCLRNILKLSSLCTKIALLGCELTKKYFFSRYFRAFAFHIKVFSLNCYAEEKYTVTRFSAVISRRLRIVLWQIIEQKKDCAVNQWMNRVVEN